MYIARRSAMYACESIRMACFTMNASPSEQSWMVISPFSLKASDMQHSLGELLMRNDTSHSAVAPFQASSNALL
jgi:hypothetical protein